jgi:predicted Zn-dependent protease
LRRELFELALKGEDESIIKRRLDDLERAPEGRGFLHRLGEAEFQVWAARRGRAEALPPARAMAEALAAERPDSPAVWAVRGDIEDLAGDVGLAIPYYRQAVALGERREPVLRRLVSLLCQQQRFVEADDILRLLRRRGGGSEVRPLKVKPDTPLPGTGSYNEDMLAKPRA